MSRDAFICWRNGIFQNCAVNGGLGVVSGQYPIHKATAGLENWLAADQTSPSMAAQKYEPQVQLANALMELPDDQREVVILKHLRNQTLQQIAEETERTVAAVAGLLRRGLAKLREVMEQE